MDIWVVWGPEPGASTADSPMHPLECFMQESEAEAWLGGGLLTLAAEWARHVERGGTLSILLHRGDANGPMSGSAVLTNPSGSRRVRDYFVERRDAVLAQERAPK